MSKKYFISFFLLVICFDVTIKAQILPFCGAEQLEELFQKDPDYLLKQQKEEQAYQFRFTNFNSQKRVVEITIPVVFHIIHNNGSENITDAQVIQGLTHLNQAFSNEGPYQNEQGVDTRIRFCLAQRDSDGNEFSGILRYESPYTDMSMFEGFDFVMSKKLDPLHYLNIQIVKKACLGSDCNVAGFAGTNRVVIEAQFFGNSLINDRVVVHEMGHVFGLIHTWQGGCKNDNCLLDGDKVCDTPPDNRTYDHCFSTSNSCSSDSDDISFTNPFRPTALGGFGDQHDDHSNFMDYNWWGCLNHFTQGQADRMHFMIHERYPTLLESKVCFPPCKNLVNADFLLPDTIVTGTNVTIENLSGFADRYQWYINGIPETTSVGLEYSFLNPGPIRVTLEAFSNDIGCDSDIKTILINVVCPIKACYDYHIDQQTLVFENCSQNSSQLEWVIIDEYNDTIFRSSLELDRFYFNQNSYLKLCLKASGEYCENTLCKFINLTSDNLEICNNEMDDDGDGLIDLFDPDCPCNDEAYQANCHPKCEILPDSFAEIKMKLKWQHELVSRPSTPSSYVTGNINSDNDSEIITLSSEGSLFSMKNRISILKGSNGELMDSFRIVPDFNFNTITTFPLLFRRLNSNQVNVIVQHGYFMFNYNQDGTENFRISHPAMMGINGASDFNNDGIAEIYNGDVIVNGETGSILFIGRNRDCNIPGSCDFFIPVAADVVGNDGKPELITGKYVYDLNIVNTTDLSGNSAILIEAPAVVEDGKCGIGDIDGDGELDIISVKGRTAVADGGIWVWNPRNQSLIASAQTSPVIPANPGDGSIPFIGDVDGDCIPEIGVVFSYKLNMYKYDGTSNLRLLYSINTSDQSGRTGVTMFDFNQDGKQELVYRDEDYLRIIEGATGKTIDSTILYSRTWYEYPIVADVDNDGEAEIIVSGSLTDKDQVHMFCFESISSPWAPARSVWNQYAYNPTQINDDLTIPRYQQNVAKSLQGTENCLRETCNTPYNNFMVQATMRTKEGCYVWPEFQRDLSVTAISKCIGDNTEICFYTTSTDTTVFRNGVTVSCYLPPWNNGLAQFLDNFMITADTTCVILPSLSGVDSVLIVINDEDGNFPPAFPNSDITECDYTNNDFTLHMGGPDFSIHVVNWECSPDSLIFYIATDNVGTYSGVSCIEGGCYFLSPFNPMTDPTQSLLEVTTWCFDYDSITMTYRYQDSFRMAIPHPLSQTQMWWTINEGGFGPGLLSSDVTDIYECNYDNNVDSISFDITAGSLDLGPNITKCETEVFTLNAGAGFKSYLWNDHSTDSIYSAIAEGIHYTEAIDLCGRVYRDTIIVNIDHSGDINLGADIMLCNHQDTVLTITGDYDEVYWSPSELVGCDTCINTIILVDTTTTLYVQARKDNCMSYDTITIERILPESDTVFMTSCLGDTIDFFGQSIMVDGVYKNLTSDCRRLDVLEVRFTRPDTTEIIEQICFSDSIFFNGQYLSTAGIYQKTLQNALGCDSLVFLDLKVVSQLLKTDTLRICEHDSIQIFGEWISTDTTLVQTFISGSGCDSIQTFLVIMTSLPTKSVQYQICEGDSVYLYGEWYNTEGEYDVHIRNIGGCDSLILMEIITKKNYAIFDTITACEGDTILVFEEWLSEDKDIVKSYNTINGCDSTSYIHVEFLEGLATTEERLLCPGDSIMVNGTWVTGEGVYETMHLSVIGCDSIHRIYVSMVPAPPLPITEIDCEELEIIVSIDAQSVWQPIWSNGDSEYQTTYPNGAMDVSLNLYTPPNCEKQLIITLPQLPNIAQIPFLSDTVIAKNQTIRIDLGLDPDEWSVLWNHTSVVHCDTCMQVDISPQYDTKISFYLTHISGCTYESTFTVIVMEDQDDIYVPNIFSPNSDNKNNQWTVFVTNNIEIISCKFFDRWGSLVYSTDKSQPTWDGTTNDKNCEQGVYIYMIEYIDSGGQKQIKLGDISLIR